MAKIMRVAMWDYSKKRVSLVKIERLVGRVIAWAVVVCILLLAVRGCMSIVYN